MNFPNKCLVDTNVPLTVDRFQRLNLFPDGVDYKCLESCIDAVKHVIDNKALVLDDGNEIFEEYLKNLSLAGQPGLGRSFVKWVHDHRYSLPPSQRVKITKNGDSYDEFPDHADLANFDPSDRKFIAVANAHPQKPPILQAVDSKWWGWKEPLKEVGIIIEFLCPDYVKSLYAKKQKNKA